MAPLRVPRSTLFAPLRARNNKELDPPRTNSTRRHSPSSDAPTTTSTMTHREKPAILHCKDRGGKTGKRQRSDGEQKRRQAGVTEQRRQRARLLFYRNWNPVRKARQQLRVEECLMSTARSTIAQARTERCVNRRQRQVHHQQQHIQTRDICTKRSQQVHRRCGERVGKRSAVYTAPCRHATC